MSSAYGYHTPKRSYGEKGGSSERSGGGGGLWGCGDSVEPKCPSPKGPRATLLFGKPFPRLHFP